MSEDVRRVEVAKRAEETLKRNDSASKSRAGQNKEEQLALKDAKSSSPKSANRAQSGSKSRATPNNVRKFRMERMMSKAELARRAGISTLTVDRVERGMNCRMDTKRKILEALELKPSDRKTVFPEDD